MSLQALVLAILALARLEFNLVLLFRVVQFVRSASWFFGHRRIIWLH